MSLQLAGKPFIFSENKRLTLKDYSFGIPDGYMAAETDDDYEFFMWLAEEGQTSSSDKIIFFAGPFVENEFANQFGVDAWMSFLEFEYYKGLEIAKDEDKPLRYEMYKNRNFAAIIKEMSKGIFFITIGLHTGIKQLRIQIKDEAFIEQFQMEHVKAWIETVKLTVPVSEGKQINDSTFFGSELNAELATEICDNLQRKMDNVNRVFVMKKQLMEEKQSYLKVDPITAQKELIALVENFTAEIDKLLNQAFFMYRALNLANRGNENLAKIREALNVFDQYKTVEVKGPLSVINRESRLNREPNMFDLPEFSEEPDEEEVSGPVTVSEVSTLASQVAKEEAIEAAKEAERMEQEKPLPKPDVYLVPDASVMPDAAEEATVKKEKKKGKSWIVILVLAIILWLALAAGGVYYMQTTYLPHKHYEKAMSLYNSEKYSLAYDEFKLAGDYMDAKWHMEDCQSKQKEE